MREKSKLYRKRVLLVLVIIAGSLLVWFLLLMPMIYNPMRRPAPLIRLHILRHIPIGTCIEEAVEVIENNERWGAPVINRYSGFWHPTLFVDGPDGSRITAIIGEQSVQAWPEIYNVPLFHERRVRIFWGFDEEGKLMEVFVNSIFAFRI